MHETGNNAHLSDFLRPPIRLSSFGLRVLLMRLSQPFGGMGGFLCPGQLTRGPSLRWILHEKFLHDRLHYRSGGTATVSTVLNNAGDRDLRMVGRSKGHKPRMVAIFLRSRILFDPHALGFFNDLSGTGLASHN